MVCSFAHPISTLTSKPTNGSLKELKNQRGGAAEEPKWALTRRLF